MGEVRAVGGLTDDLSLRDQQVRVAEFTGQHPVGHELQECGRQHRQGPHLPGQIDQSRREHRTAVEIPDVECHTGGERIPAEAFLRGELFGAESSQSLVHHGRACGEAVDDHRGEAPQEQVPARR